MARYELRKVGVWDNDTLQSITRSDGVEWAAYRAWLRAGGVPDPQPPDPVVSPTQAELDAAAEISARVAMRNDLRSDPTVQFLRTHTPAECAAWVNTNVTDLASAKNVLSKLAMICAYLARERLAQQ